MILYRSRYLVSMDQPAIEDGGLLVSQNRIVDVGSFRDLAKKHSASKVDLGDCILLPGLINAHCHLELSSLRNGVSTQKSFARWIQRINAIKRTLTDEDYVTATIQGARELLRHGTTSVVNIESMPEILEVRHRVPLRMWCCYEMIDIRMRQHTDLSMKAALSFFDLSENALTKFALSPHSPYTASTALFQLAGKAARQLDMLVTTHVAESVEEMQMFRDAEGPLFDFLAGLGRDMSDCGQSTPLEHVIEKGGLAPGSLLVHLNELSENDYALLARWSGGAAIHAVHCPKSHLFFRHTPFPYEKLVKAKANISLGTDSLASNDRLDMFAEMRCFAEMHPDISPAEIVKMVTRNPAIALQEDGCLGVLRPGAHADAIAIPVENMALANVHEAILHNSRPVDWTMIDGKIVKP